MKGALVPHAPLLLPEVTAKAGDLRDIWDGLGRIRIPDNALVVVLTPHSKGIGAYAHARGSLSGFGLAQVVGDFRTEPVAELQIASLAGPLDHGALVALLLLEVVNPVLVVGLGEASDMSDMSDAVEKVRGIAAGRETFVVASAHTSARVTERAPLPYSFDAVRLESRFITGIEADCAAARDLADELWAVGDSCSRTTLRAFGELFAGAKGNVLAYGSPFGVGYPVVTAEIDV